MNKKRIVACAFQLFGAVSLAACGSSQTRVVAEVVDDSQRGLTVVGLGEAEAEPDVARASIGVEVRAPDVGAAVEESNRRMEALLTSLKNAGVAPKDLQTENYSIRYEEPHERPPEPLPRLEAQPSAPTKASPEAAAAPSTGTSASRRSTAALPGRFVVRNVAQVTIRQLDRLGQILQAATEAGANEIWGISFEIDDPEPIRVRARERAVQNARSKAEALARLGGVTLGSPVAIRESGSDMPRPAGARMMKLESSGVPVQRGTVAVTERVEVVYAIRQ